MAAVRFINRGALGLELHNAFKKFDEGVASAAGNAASAATDKSQEIFRDRLSGRRPIVGPRPGRPTTQDTFATHIRWRRDGSGFRFDLEKIRKVAPYWLIQEIGSGNAATMREGEGATSVSVKSQVGRRLPRSLHWSGGSVGKDQLIEGPSEAPMTIRNEIKGKGYIRIGGNRGFRVYERLMEDAFMRAFTRR